MTKWLTVTSGLVAVALTAGASGRQASARNLQPDVAELWLDPADLPDRDLMDGPGGAAQRPDADQPFAFVAHKESGVNQGYDVRDAQGRSWSVKLGEEAQSEVAVSRLLWAIGFHQPVVYYLPAWTLTGTDAGLKPAGRFRLDDPAWTAAEEWSWYENPFVETQEFRGLIVAQFLLANWDLKTSNNRIYATAEPFATPRRRYVVRDLGASLGSARQHLLFAFLGTRGSQGTKNDIAGFERRASSPRSTTVGWSRLPRSQRGTPGHRHSRRRGLDLPAVGPTDRGTVGSRLSCRRLSARYLEPLRRQDPAEDCRRAGARCR